MSIELPESTRYRKLASEFGFELSDAQADAFTQLAKGLAVSYERLDELRQSQPREMRRDVGRVPLSHENPYNAWAWFSEIEGAPTGLLKGVEVGVKDNICVAGLPMRNGSRILDGLVPTSDATVITRILAAGGKIAGKTMCENLCFSGNSHTSHPAPVKNPRNPKHSAGGSSSGSGAAIAAGDVSMCLGGDQGGSIRMPAAWCGCVGLKPTFGLVPYSGIFPVEPTLDHCGPMGRAVEDVARLLTVIAGPDGRDSRQTNNEALDYLQALKQPLRGLRIGVVSQGFGRPESEAATDDQVRRILNELTKAGAETDEISIPWHADGYHVYTSIIIEGSTQVMFQGNAMGYGWRGPYNDDISQFWGTRWRAALNDLPAAALFVLLSGQYMHERYQGRFYGTAQSLRRELRAAYDTALGSFEVLAMPTIPFRAPELLGPDAGIAESVTAALNMEGNTAPFDVSGHPAISMPCGTEDGLPIGIMFAGKAFDEMSVLRAARGVEMLNLQ